MQKLIKKMTGYKATDKNMRCRGFQFELGKTYELDKEEPLVLCEYGFHFCEHPSGPWAYYFESGTRIFKVEAEDVIAAPTEAGADFKRVCRKITLTEEVKIGGDRNTGDRNTGDGNTGNSNTGDGNTGDGNTGNRNTGDGNTGYGNTGNRNTGYGNTGYGNACDYSSGFFNTKEQPLIIFDKKTKTKREKLPFDLINDLSWHLSQNEDFDIKPFLKIPNATAKKIKDLHKKHIESRRNINAK